MNIAKPKFNKTDQPEFFKVLNHRVNKYFEENNLSKKANLNMVFKTIFMLSLYFVPYIIMLSGIVTAPWAILTLWAIMGLGMAGIGLSVMHDANHESYSANATVNKLVGMVINFMGSFQGTWKIQHNVLHHSYTNIEGFDEDHDIEFMRFSPNKANKPYYKYQAYYAPLFYCLMSLNRFLVKDFQQVLRFRKNGLLASQGLTIHSALFQILIWKTWYVLLIIIAPIYVAGLSIGQVLLGFLIMHFICGIILALIFQSAHIIAETDFFVSGENGTMENNWAIHQLKTTANFANDSVLFSWLIGGLNFQIEHHLFPNICHVHYHNISTIVRHTTAEFDLPYHHHPSFYGAVKSHFTHLNQLGRGEL